MQLSEPNLLAALSWAIATGKEAGRRFPNAARGITASNIFFSVAIEGWHGPESGSEYDYKKIRAIVNAEKAVQPGDRVDIE